MDLMIYEDEQDAHGRSMVHVKTAHGNWLEISRCKICAALIYDDDDGRQRHADWHKQVETPND